MKQGKRLPSCSRLKSAWREEKQILVWVRAAPKSPFFLQVIQGKEVTCKTLSILPNTPLIWIGDDEVAVGNLEKSRRNLF